MTTANKALNEPAYNSSAWDVPLNNNFGYLDAALGNTAIVSNTSAYTLVASEYQCMRLLFNGSLSSDLSISIPSGVGGVWLVTNSTTDASAAVPTFVTIKTTAGGSVGVVVPRNVNTVVFSNGSEVYFAQQNTTPSGVIIQFAGNTAPTGYLTCDGSAVNRTTYPNLFAAIGTTWGAGNGTTTFNVPDLRGMFVRGTGTNATQSGAVGPSVGAYQADAYLNHTHGITDPGHSHILNNNAAFSSGAGSGLLVGIQSTSSLGTSTQATGITVNTSTTGSTENRSKNYGILYCIKI